MKFSVAVILGLFLFTGAALAQSDNTVHVKAFPGSTVGAKITNAMQSCPAAAPCILVVDASLVSLPAGAIPTLCSGCTLLDYRSGFPVADGIPPVNAVGFSGATADAQLNAAISYACTNGPHEVSAYGLSNLTISSTVNLGCSSGAPLVIEFDASVHFVPGSTSVNMFEVLPGAITEGTLAVDIRGVSGYSGNILSLAGYEFDNQPGDTSTSTGRTSVGDFTVYGQGNTTATALYLEANSTTEFVQFVDFGRITVFGTLNAIYAVASNSGWINSNSFQRVGCSNTMHCLRANTTNSTGNFVGNHFLVFESEYGTDYSAVGLDAVWFEGSGVEEDNDFPVTAFWDWASNGGDPSQNYTLKVDSTLAYNVGNTFAGMVNLAMVYDPNLTLEVTDVLAGTRSGYATWSAGQVTAPRVEATAALYVGGGSVSITTGTAVPSGSCTSGSLYTNQAGTSGGNNTLYVCTAGAWVAVK